MDTIACCQQRRKQTDANGYDNTKRDVIYFRRKRRGRGRLMNEKAEHGK